MNPDIFLLHALNNFVGTFPPLDWVVRMLVNDYAMPTLCALFLGALWFAGDTSNERRANQRAMLFALLGVLIAMAIIKDIQQFYFRPRPFATEEVKLLFYRPSVSSFPSVPVATLSCYVTAVWCMNRALANWFLIPALLFALARVYAGVHFPFDIIGGALIGFVSVMIVIRLRVVNQGVDYLIGITDKFAVG